MRVETSPALGVLANIEAQERKLIAKGFPPMSPWWRERFTTFYGTGRRQLVLRVGRRGGKSSSLCRVAVLEALHGDHAVPPGDTGVVAIISVKRDEANQRLLTIRAILDALGVSYGPIEGGIKLDGLRVAFKVYTGSVSGVSGFTCICAICDEVAKWRDADTGANPAKEVLASLRPTMATQRRAHIFLSSSPVGTQDAHAVAYDQGETDFQCVAQAPTWETNPTVTEAETRELEPDERIWLREYKAIPQAGVLGAFDTDDIERAFLPRSIEKCQRSERALIIDASSGRKDAWTWGIAEWVTPPGAPSFLRLSDVDGMHGAFARTTSSADIITKLVGIARERGARSVHGDQREEFMIQGAFSAQGLGFFPHPWTATSKPAAVEMVRRWMRERVLSLPPGHEKMRRELHAFEERITPSGAFTFGARGNGHDDYVSLLVTAAMVVEARYLIPPAPIVVPPVLTVEQVIQRETAEHWQREQDAINDHNRDVWDRDALE